MIQIEVLSRTSVAWIGLGGFDVVFTDHRWLQKLHQSAELKPKEQSSRYVFGPDVAQAVWWIETETPHAGRSND